MCKYISIIFWFLINDIGSSICAEDESCPPLEVKQSAEDQNDAFHAIFSTKKYDNKLTRYFVMTPSSSPYFANPNGDPFDWSTSECVGKSIFFNCHAWLGDGNAPWVYALLSTYVDEHEGCAVSSDYPGAVKTYRYITAARETNNIAQGLSLYIMDNICKVTDCSKHLQLHGLSLGAHVCGVAGYLLKQRGVIVPRMIASDAAGPVFNLYKENSKELHLSKESAAFVMNLKTSCIFGSSLISWAHQTQIIGDLCGCHQNQCPKSNELCSHAYSVIAMRSTMEKKFINITLKKCYSCSCINTSYVYPAERENLGYKSMGTHGVYKTGKLSVCMDLFKKEKNSNHN